MVTKSKIRKGVEVFSVMRDKPYRDVAAVPFFTMRVIAFPMYALFVDDYDLHAPASAWGVAATRNHSSLQQTSSTASECNSSLGWKWRCRTDSALS